MPMILSGDGTVIGLAVGGLPEGSIINADIADVASSKLTGALPADVATAKAWVNFNGDDVVAIRSSYNVSSITDNGLGDYTINFATAMADANYCWSWGVRDGSTTGRGRFMCLTDSAVISTTQFQSMWQDDDNNVMQDVTSACLTFLGGQA